MLHLEWFDLALFLLYFVVVAGIGWYTYRKRPAETDAAEFFLAEGGLTWWAIGASLIASNISAEQFIGTAGSGFAMGLAIASYEWMAAITILIVAVFFLPVYLKNRIYTMPQFLEQRYDRRVSLVMAVFWLLVYVFVNLTSILYLGALTIESILGVPFIWAALALAAFAIVITLGGMRVIGYTDVFQVLVLIIGGLMTAYIALDLVAQHEGGQGFWQGLAILQQKVPEHFQLLLNPGDVMMPDGKGGLKDAWQDLPAVAVLVGGMWIANLSYWGCNQYITQRALGAKDLDTAQKGLLFGASLKLLMPVMVVLPGIAAFYLFKTGALNGLFQTGMMTDGIVKPDKSYSLLLGLLPVGFKGVAFAALTAAIVASLAGKANSIATILTLDLYKPLMAGEGKPDVSEKRLVYIGRVTVGVAFAVALLVAPSLRSLDQGFQYIQEYTGFITPGITAIFLLGLFWKRSHPHAALTAALLTIPLSAVLKFQMPDLPFLHRMGWVFVMLAGLMVVISLVLPPKESQIQQPEKRFPETSMAFKIGSILIMGILAALYIVYA